MWALEFRNNSQTCYNNQGTVDIVKVLKIIDKKYTDRIVEITTRCELALQNMFKDPYRFAIDIPTRVEYPIKERVNITFVDSFNIISECLHRKELPTIGILVTINTVHKITATRNFAIIDSNQYENVLKECIRDILSDVYTVYLHSVSNNKGLYE